MKKSFRISKKELGFFLYIIIGVAGIVGIGETVRRLAPEWVAKISEIIALIHFFVSTSAVCDKYKL